MTALVAAETLVLVLLVLLVAGLLRSHAEILRRLGPPEDDEEAAGEGLVLRRDAPQRSAGDVPAPDVAGMTLAGDSLKVSVAPGSPPTLLAFLSSGCTICRNFWHAFGSGQIEEFAPDIRVVAVAKDGSHESPSRLREMAPEGLPVLLSTAAWDAYSVPGSPYFVYVEDGAIAGEGSATLWPQLASLLRDARADVRGGERRAGRIDATLEAAGIGPGHPSLYPSRGGAEE